MKLAVIGSGYVGLVAGACFADVGNEVVCVDKDQSKIDSLKEGTIPIYEPGLGEYVRRNLREERLRFTLDMKSAVEQSDVLFVAVGTPPGEDGSADLTHVLDVAAEIGTYMNGFKVIVDKSTVPVGTTDKVHEVIASKTKHDFAVVSNPEFLKEGAAIEDFMKPDRVIIGTSNKRAEEILKNLYAPFVNTGKPIIMMDEKSAELTKYAANSILATKISFINEIANLCDLVGADINLVRKGIGSDKRIGQYFIFPGTGYGGSCFPKDVKALIKTASNHNYEMQVLKAVEEVNERQKTIMLPKIERYFKGDLKDKVIALWGLSFKPRTNDMREAPSIEMVKALLGKGVKIQAHDPEALDEARIVFKEYVDKQMTLSPKRYDVLEGADALVIMTEWNQFREPDFNLIKESLRSHAIFDGRNLYDPERMKNLGFEYFAVGRAKQI